MRWAERHARELGRHVERLGSLRSRLEVEVMGHLEDAAARHRERGLSPAEAQEQALKDFGAPDVIARQLLEDLEDMVTMRVTQPWPRRLAWAGA